MRDEDPIRLGDLPAPDNDDEQGVLDFLRGVGHAGLPEVTGLYEQIGALERLLEEAVARAGRTRAETVAHEAELVALIVRLREANTKLRRSLGAARMVALPTGEPDAAGPE